MSALRPICVRVGDWLRERRIARLAARVKRLVAAGDTSHARAVNGLLTRAVHERSTEQVARLERARGLRK